RGVDQVANAVAITLGPKGHNVAIDKTYGVPTVTHDGVTVAKEIALPNAFQNMGAQLLKEAATKTNDLAGDGTTTATVLAQAMVHEGMKNLVAGANAMLLKKGIMAALAAVSDHIAEQAIPVNTREAIAQVAGVSAQDQEIGELIATVMDKVGKDGVITVEDGNSMNMEVEYVDGMQFDRGYISPYFVTNHGTMEVVLDNPYILIYDRKIRSAEQLIPILEQLIKSGKREMVIIAEDVEGQALATLVLNTMSSIISLVAVKAPGFGDRRKDTLRDIAILTGGTVISQEVGRELETITLEDLGRADKVITTKEHTTIIDGTGDATVLKDHLQSIQHEIDQSTSDYDREKLKERLAKLSGGVAVIKVGAATESELKEKKHRIEDALHAIRAAIEDGIVPGGGVTLMNAVVALVNLKFEYEDINTGVNVVRSALEVPLRRLAENAGEEGAVIIANVRRAQTSEHNPRIGYNVMTGEYVDMITAGIPDPARVTRSAVESAASIAAMILTIEALVADQAASVA
ncbi:MAG TPA: chaperonin GroEL, partial [Phototrophicaceae bacterium]|nr:chaperonin GroEL [Phototrophicaceae bacterium]